jgi:hypothetical protein
MAQPRTSVIGVFPTRDDAWAAAEAAQRAGARPAAIRVASRDDKKRELQAEMLEEQEQSIMGPGNVGPFTREMQRAMLPLTIIGLVVGAVIALPIAVVEFGGFTWWGRMVLVAVVGGVIGAAVGFLFGGMYGARRPEEPLATERGVTVAVDDAPATAIEALRARHPLRLDAYEPHGRPLRTITSEEDEHPTPVVDELERHLRDRRLEG